MDLQLVNPRAKYPKVTLLQPPPLGYIHVAATVGPPPGRTPFPGRSPQKAALLTRLGSLARELERLAIIERATVYRAILFAPPAGAASQPPRLARYDVVVLIDTTSPEVLGEVQATEPYKVLAAAVTEAATDVHIMTARCRKRVGDVDKARQGLFLFNYFARRFKAHFGLSATTSAPPPRAGRWMGQPATLPCADTTRPRDDPAASSPARRRS